MKFFLIILAAFSITACTTIQKTEYVQYRQVTVVPPPPVFESTTVIEQEPIDVTTTTVEYY